MRFVYQTAIILSLTGLVAYQAPAQITPSKLSVTNYQMLSEQRVTRSQSQYTYRADLVNTGPATPAPTATVVSAVPSIEVVTGMGNLHFPAAGAGKTVTSTNTFTVLVDRTGDTDFKNLIWSYNAPVANAGPNQTVPIGTTATLNASGTTNPSGIGSLTYNWVFTSRPPGTRVVLQNSTGIMPSFVPDVKGDFVLTLTVDNGAGKDTSTVTVSTVSSRPVADAGPDQTVKAGTNVILSGAGSHDVDGNALTYAWTIIAKPSRSSAVLSGANTVSPSFVADADGSYTVQLIVSDVNGTSDPAMVSITTQNSSPVARAGANQVVTTGSTVQLSGSGSTDVDGDPLTYRWSLTTVPSGSHAALSNGSIVNPTFVADLDGSYIAQLIVNDGHTDSLPSTVTITTNTVQPPVANAGSDQSLAHGSTVTLNGSGTDPQNLPLTYHWSLTTAPAGSNAVLAGATTKTPSFIADLKGTYVAQLIVNNGTSNSAPSTVTISSTNTAPVANAGPAQTVTAGSTVTLDGSGSSDAEHDALTYTWALLNAPVGSGASLLSPNIVSPTFVPDLAGTYVVQLIVRDSDTASQPSTVTITANAAGSLTLSPNPLNLSTVAADLTITIPSAAGTGGQPVKLAALDATVISLPATATVPEGATSTTVQVTPLSPGSTLVIASLPGVRPATAQVNVTSTGIAISLSSNAVGVARSITGTVTLTNQAPSGGVDVALSVDHAGLVTMPASVHVNAGATTATFTVTGVAAGIANITGSSPGYTSGATAVTVSQVGAITLQANASVGVGQTKTLGVTLATPAPVGGVTVSLVSGDTNKLTVTQNVNFSQGATTPDTPVQITGVNYGSATISATAPGFSSDSKAVQVAVNLSFTPQTLTMGPGGVPQNLTLAISGVAPAGGLLVTLSSDNTGAATVPATISIPAGSSTVPVPVTGVSVGAAVITASSSLPGVSSGTANVSVVPGVVITTPSLPSGLVGAAYNLTVTASGGTSPYTFAAPNLPAGLVISNGGVISGTPTTAGTTTVNISATDSSNPTHLVGTASLLLTINAALSIGTTSLPGGTVGVPYNASVTATGGASPYSFAATGLPAGVTLSNAGVFSGSPTATGSSTITVTVTDSTNPTHITATATFPVSIAPALAVSTTSLPAGTVGVGYNVSLGASNGIAPYSFAATGLPAGLTLTSAGLLSGTPTGAGVSTLNISVQDSTNPTHLTATTSLSLTINPAPLSVTTTSLPNGAVGIGYNASVAVTGGTMPYSFFATGLPAGLSMSATGQISGTPTATGTATAAIVITDNTSPTHLSITVNLPITINPPVLAVATTSLPAGMAGVQYNFTVTATGGSPGYAFSATGLPTGLNMAANGQITGTPGAAGTSNVVITVTDQAAPTHASAMATLTLTVAPPTLAITTTTLPSGVAGTGYNATVVAAGGTPAYTFTAAGLPAPLSISAGGVITGTPAAAGTSNVTITVTDLSSPSHMTATATLVLTIAPPALVITTSTLPAGLVGASYNATVNASGGTPGYSFSASNLPAGLSISTGGVISGTPGAPGTVNAVITVTDSTNPTHATASATLAIAIAPAQLVITTNTLPSGGVGSAYNAVVTAAGGTPAYAFTASGLPAGLHISAAGVISGSPTASGTTNAIISVTDQSSPTMTATASIAIVIAAPPPAITTTALPAGTVGANYSANIVATGGTLPYTFGASGLPAGLSISNGGIISGHPSVSGSNNVTITLTDGSTPVRTATANLTLTVSAPPLQFTSSFLPNGTQFTPYSGGLSITGGTAPYNWNIISGTLPSGLSLNQSTGLITGLPGVPATATPLTFQVIDSGNPTQQTITATAALTIAPAAASALTITGGTIGQGLQDLVTVTLSTPPATATHVIVSSGSPSNVALARKVGDVGTGTLDVLLAAGDTSFSLFAQALTNSGSSTITATASGYTTATSTVNTSPAGFVLSGTNGVGGSFTVNQGSSTTLTVSAAQLDSSGAFVKIQQVRGALTVPVTLGNSAGTFGTLSTTSLTFPSGTDSLTVQFNANPTTAGSTFITVNPPSGFRTPAGNANVLPITVQVATILPTDVSVGKNLETNASVTLQGVAQNDLFVTVMSNNSSKVLLALNPTDAGSTSISLKITAGHRTTPDFYVYGLASSGTATYSASAPGFGSANGTVILNPSGFILSGPFGPGANFFAIMGSQPPEVDVYSAVLDGTGNWTSLQPLAGGISTNVSLTSTPGSVGTIGSSVAFAGGSGFASTQFQAVSPGTATLAALTPSGFSSSSAGTLNVTVRAPGINIDSGNTIGNGLQQQASLFLGSPAPSGGLQVLLTSDNTAAIAFSSTATTAGSPSLMITVPEGAFSATYFMQGLANGGTVNVTASATGYSNGSGTEALAPAGVMIAGPSGPGQTAQAHVGTNVPVTLSTVILDSFGNVTMTQPLAGGSNLSVQLTNTDNTIGTIPSPVIISGGTSDGTVQFTPLKVGQDPIRVIQPSGFSTPNQLVTVLMVNVQ